ncbi:MAG: hypothetical protein ACR2P7_01800 [bacterium]
MKRQPSSASSRRARPSLPAALGALVVAIAAAAMLLAATETHANSKLVHIVHTPSGKCIHPVDRHIWKGTKLVLDGERHKRVCGDPKSNTLNFHYNPNSKRIFHPYTTLCAVPEYGGVAQPKRKTKLMLEDCSREDAEFTLHEGKYFRHVSGKCMHILPGRGTTWVTVNDGASVILDDVCRGERIAWNLIKPGAEKKSADATKLVHRFSGLCAQPWRFKTTNNISLRLMVKDCDRHIEAMYFEMLPSGVIRHVQSGKCVHPDGGRHTPYDDTVLVLHDGCTKGNLKFRLRENGTIQHQVTGKCINPQGGRLVPGNETRLVLHKHCTGTEYEFDFLPDE